MNTVHVYFRLTCFLLGILFLQACTGGTLVQRSEIIYPVYASLESGRQDPQETLTVGFTGGASLEEYANRFHLRRFSGTDTSHLFKYYPDYYASFRMQYAYRENYSPTIRFFASFPQLKPLEVDTLLQHVTGPFRTLFGIEFGSPVYFESSHGFSHAFRVGFRFFEEVTITKRSLYFNKSDFTTSQSKHVKMNIPVEYIFNYQINPTTELIGGVNLNTLLYKNREVTGPDLISYKAGITSYTSPNVRLTLWVFYNGKQTVMYDDDTKNPVKKEETSPYLALQFAYLFPMTSS